MGADFVIISVPTDYEENISLLKAHGYKFIISSK
jgi:hypothetical protein